MDNSLNIAIWESWALRPGLLAVLVLAAVFYLRGFLRLHAILPNRFPWWRVASFLGGLIAFYLSIASPLDAFALLLLQAHMVQHILLAMISPLLLLYGAPYLPLLRGLPRWLVREAVGPLLAWPAWRKFMHRVGHPMLGLMVFMLTTVVWHVPYFYSMAIRSQGIHEIEHAMFFLTALWFWLPVIRPWPYRFRWPEWVLIPYLLAANVQNTMLAGFITICERVIYQPYQDAPRLFNVTAAEDQMGAGALMWMMGSMTYLVYAAWVTIMWLSPQWKRRRREAFLARAGRKSAPVVRLSALFAGDVLAWPVVGKVLRSSAFRRGVQGTMLALAVWVVLDGFLGPDVSPLNTAGVLPWTYWRAFVVIALLLVGNLFCFSCPFTLVRDWARKLHVPVMVWPRWLRSKWPAVALVVLYLWAYEAFALWDRPAWTAGIILLYFGVAVMIDVMFRGASFCKYVCPIGQFHFIQSAISPMEVKVREPDVCSSCRTYDCLRGNEKQRGCELYLFQPKKQGNADCTFCLDCVRACPHDNVGLISVTPAEDLWKDVRRSSVGRRRERLDFAALAAVFSFGAFANAAAMVAPSVAWMDGVVASSGIPRWFMLVLLALLVLLVLPLGLSALCAWAGGSGRPLKKEIAAMAWTFVPLGFAMWLAHFLFHLITGWGTAAQAILRGTPHGGQIWMPPGWVMQNLVPMEIAILGVGLMVSWLVAWKATGTEGIVGGPRFRRAWPWMLLGLVLYLAGIWIFLQPMQMRGTMMGGG